MRNVEREQAIQLVCHTNGSGVDEVTSEVDRYCAWPDRPAATRSVTAKSTGSVEGTTGPRARSSISSVNDAVVKTGGVPMVVLAREMMRLFSQQQDR